MLAGERPELPRLQMVGGVSNARWSHRVSKRSFDSDDSSLPVDGDAPTEAADLTDADTAAAAAAGSEEAVTWLDEEGDDDELDNVIDAVNKKSFVHYTALITRRHSTP